jgi:hypothetical protein
MGVVSGIVESVESIAKITSNLAKGEDKGQKSETSTPATTENTEAAKNNEGMETEDAKQ